jgi:hypothetical protein
MNVDDEFKTVDAVIGSKADTSGVDAFALSLIKSERQARKLFTHLVYQFPAFTKVDVPTLRATLEANNRVYFAGLLTGFDALYPKSIETLVGPDYRRLKGRLAEASRHRNKIFHGQLTVQSLSRSELLSLVEDIRKWCEQLARGAFAELMYDGFGRNSFKKSSVSDLWRRLKVEFKKVEDYKQFIRNHMQR